MRTWRPILWSAVLLVPGLVISSVDAPARAGDLKIDTSATLASSDCSRVSSARRGRPKVATGQGSTVALTHFGDTAVVYVAHEDDKALITVDLDQGKEVARIVLAGAPSSALVLPDGRVAVALRDRARVDVFEPGHSAASDLRLRCSLAVAAEPVGLAAPPSGDSILVTSGWGRSLAAFDAMTGARVLEVPLAREPRNVVVDDEGRRAFVAHVVDATLSVVDLPDGKSSPAPLVRKVDLAPQKGLGGAAQKGCQGFALAKAVGPERGGERQPLLKGALPPPPQPALPKTAKAQDQAPQAAAAPATPITPQGAPAAGPAPIVGRIFAPMVAVDPGRQGRSSGGYGSGDGGPAERAMVSVVDVGAERALTTSVSAGPTGSQDACLLPRGAAYSSSSQSLFVTCLGSDAVVELDARAVDPSRRERVRHRVAAGPTGVAIDDAANRMVVFSQFASKLTVISLDGKTAPRQVALASKQPLDRTLARGRELFHATTDTRISADGRACASCHPDGREDALTWSTPDGPRQTPMLIERLNDSGPFSWSGSHKTVEIHLDATFERLGGHGFSGRDKTEMAALISYVKSLRLPPSGPLSVAAARGEKLFSAEGQSCTSCHPGGKTDGKMHSVLASEHGAQPVDTPSLRGVRGTGPYFHDGRFQTLDAMLASPNHAMGTTMSLTRSERLDLVAYLETL